MSNLPSQVCTSEMSTTERLVSLTLNGPLSSFPSAYMEAAFSVREGKMPQISEEDKYSITVIIKRTWL